VRILAATNKDLGEEIKGGRFREDLFFRLNVIPLSVPPLRERGHDVIRLAEHFVSEFATEYGRRQKRLAPDAQQAMRGYHWPGNVRELRNVIERAVILSTGEFIESKHLPPLVADSPEVVKPTLSIAPGTTVEEAERRLILMTLEHTRDNKTRAAEILGISLKTLHNKLNKLRGRVPGRKTDEVVSQ